MSVIGTIDIFRGTGSLSAREFPYFALGATNNPVPVKTFQGKFTEDLDQAIQVPTFDGWSTCNLLRLTSGTFVQWMWITDVSRTTDTAGSITLACTWCPTMDISRRSDYSVARRYKGNWTRIPGPDLAMPLHFEVAGGNESPLSTSMYSIPRCADLVKIDQVKGTLAWMQVTFSTSSSNNAAIGMYGFFVDVLYPAMGTALGGGDGLETYYRYPTFLEALTDPYGSMGITASSIIDISVSAIPPFKCAGVNKSLPVISLLNSSGTRINPTQTKGGRYAYDFTSGSGSSWPQLKQSAVLTYSNVQTYCGSIRLTDPYGATVGTFPQTAGTGANLNAHTVTATAISDISGITLCVTLDGTVIKVPMPHIPYIGTQWDEYRAYSLSTDRQAMEWSISSSREALKIQKDAGTGNALIGIGSSLLSGDIAGAVKTGLSTLIGFQAQDRSQDLSERNARFQQSLTEQLAMAATPTTYATNYGFEDILRITERPYRIAWWAPSGTTGALFVNYIHQNGCPVKKVNVEVPMEAEGFYQGCITSETAPVHGPRLDRFNSLLQSGFKQIFYEDVTE